MKIHIVGASGSGVTTLGSSLAQNLSVPYFDSDDYYWKKTDPPFTTRVDRNERNKTVLHDLAVQDHWILGGSIINWDCEWPIFDAIIFLWIPPDIRIPRLIKREKERYGDIIFTDPERNRLFREFIEWARGYDTDMARGRTHAAHQRWLAAADCPVLQIRQAYPVDVTREKVLMWISNLGIR